MLVGDPLSFRAVPTSAFAGVRAAAPPGGQADVRCAPDGARLPDGPAVVPEDDGFPHATVEESVFTRPGAWACVARGVAEGRDEAFDTALFGTPWSPPLRIEVRSDFRRRTGAISHPRARRPAFSFAAEWPELASGGRGSVTIFRFTGCRGSAFKLRRLDTYRGRFGAKRMRIRIRRPRATAFYLGRFTFSGTHFLRAGRDPNPMLLVVKRRRIGFADPRVFPRCSG